MEKVIIIGIHENVCQQIDRINGKEFEIVEICLLGEEQPLLGLENKGIRQQIKQAIVKYPCARVLVLAPVPIVYEIINKLIALNICREDLFINEVKEKYFSCDYLESGISVCGDGVKNCCGNEYDEFSRLPALPLDDQLLYNVDAFLERFFELKKQIIEKNRRGEKTHCTNCPYLKYDYWAKDKVIKILNFSLDHSCNLMCDYCYKQQKDYVKPQKQIDIVELIKSLKESKYVRIDAPIYYSSGEICIQKNANDIIELLKPYEVTFYTNATRYNNNIHEIIKKPQSCAIISLDSGTPGTYARIKGVDMFGVVCENIKKYASDGGHIILKYIIKEENSNSQDINGFLALCQTLNIKNIRISRDWRMGEIAETDMAIKSASARMYYKARKYNINCFMDGITVCDEW